MVEEFYALSARQPTGRLYLVTGDAQEAQDVVPEAFARVWKHPEALLRDGAPEAWVRVRRAGGRQQMAARMGKMSSAEDHGA